jgi:hypothetical protein
MHKYVLEPIMLIRILCPIDIHFYRHCIYRNKDVSRQSFCIKLIHIKEVSHLMRKYSQKTSQAKTS